MRLVLSCVVALVVLAACAGSVPTPRAATPVPSATPTASGDGTLAPTSASPTPEFSRGAGPSLIAVPDPLNPMLHQAGEEVSVKGVTLVFRGLQSRGGGSFYATFEVREGRLENARLLVGWFDLRVSSDQHCRHSRGRPTRCRSGNAERRVTARACDWGPVCRFRGRAELLSDAGRKHDPQRAARTVSILNPTIARP